MKRRNVFPLMGTSLACGVCFARTADESLADALCSNIEKNLNTLLDRTPSSCIAPAGGEALLIVFKDDLWTYSKLRKAAVVMVIGAAGHALNSKPVGKVKSVLVVDQSLARNKHSWEISTNDVRRLQRDVHSGAMSLEQMYEMAERASRLRAQ